ncbi:MAG: flagellar biosynthetic protein FliR [Clostridia bacterium]|nr:flagellar biosynthetic protein FliR [Clostridia bacterium]
MALNYIDNFNTYLIFLFVCCRMAGLVFFNPIFGRSSIPVIVKIGLSLGLALNTTAVYQGVFVQDYSAIETFLSMAKEFAVGFAIGYVVNIFMAVFHLAGEVMDLQMGYSMATMYDPSSNSNISVTGNLVTIMFTLLFFITDSHLNLMVVASKSYSVIPIGMSGLSKECGVYAIELFGNMFTYAVQLAIPIIVVEVVVEVAVGILMKMVPNINVFVVNLQLKMIAGFVALFTLIPVIVKFLSKLNEIMMEDIRTMITFLV